ncbi:hypothetical protein [Arthrobacter sp. MAHUQ-56]
MDRSETLSYQLPNPLPPLRRGKPARQRAVALITVGALLLALLAVALFLAAGSGQEPTAPAATPTATPGTAPPTAPARGTPTITPTPTGL